MIDSITKTTLLFDFYGNLLSPRKRQVMELYYEENMSLAEIAEEFSISRAAVFDSLKKGEEALKDYEEKLGLLDRFFKMEEDLKEINDKIHRLAKEHKGDTVLESQLKKISMQVANLVER